MSAVVELKLRDDRPRDRVRATLARLGWPLPADDEELELAGAWVEKHERHHGRTARPGFHPMWRFAPEVAAWVQDQIDTLPRPIVHVCAGQSQFGDVRLDLYTDADVRGTMFALPVKGAAAIICDPPWLMPYHLRARLNSELYRATRRGGELVWVSGWLPDRAWVVDDAASAISSKASGWPADPLFLVRARRVA